MIDVRQEKGSPFFTGIFEGPDGKSKEFSTKSVFRSVARYIVMTWVILSLAAQSRILTKRQYFDVAKKLYHIATGIKIPNVTVREGSKVFLGESGGLEPETLRSRRAVMAAFVGFLGPEADGIIEDVTRLHIVRFRDRLLLKNDPSTVNNRLEVLVTFFNFAIDFDWTEKNPALGVRAHDPDAKKKSKVVRRPFRRREAFLLIEPAGVEMTGVFITDFHIGARQGDVTCMAVPQVTESAEQDGVDMDFFNDKGEKDMDLPTLPEYGAFMLEFLRHHPDPRTGEKLFWTLGKKETKSGRTSAVDRAFNKLCQAQGLRDAKTAPIGKGGKRKYEIDVHCIRYSTNMALKLAGMPPALVAVFLGHGAEVNKKYDRFEEKELMRKELYRVAGKECRSKKPTWMTIQDILDLTVYATEKLRRIRLGLPALTLDEAEAFLVAKKAAEVAVQQAAPQEKAA
jgi:hypothetical protein